MLSKKSHWPVLDPGIQIFESLFSLKYIMVLDVSTLKSGFGLVLW